MSPRRLPKSVRKFLRRRKAEIRRQFLSSDEAEVKIRELVAETFQRYNRNKAEAKEAISDQKATKESKASKRSRKSAKTVIKGV